MDSKEFKNAFGDTAKANGFDRAFGGWFKESSECIMVLDLQKSYYSCLYYLNVKIFVQGMFGSTYCRSKDLVKRDIGNISTRSPQKFNDVLDLENLLNEGQRKEKLNILFTDFIVPFSQKAMSISGIRELAKEKEFILYPAVKDQLDKLQS